MTSRSSECPVRLELALQGGGAHSAFAWSVLDRLLDEPRLQIVPISGASARAMNAVLVALGVWAGGPKVARVALRQFWKRFSAGVAAGKRGVRPTGAAAGPDAVSLRPFPLWAAAHAAWRTFAEQAVAGWGRVPQDHNPLGPLLDLPSCS